MTGSMWQLPSTSRSKMTHMSLIRLGMCHYLLAVRRDMLADLACRWHDAGTATQHHRKHALALLQACATSVLCLRSPEDSTLPGIARDKLAAMLFGDVPPPQVDSVKLPNEMGQKTKIQLTAERQVSTCTHRLGRSCPCWNGIGSHVHTPSLNGWACTTGVSSEYVCSSYACCQRIISTAS